MNNDIFHRKTKMRIGDLVKFDVTDEMIAEAYQDAEQRDTKVGEKTQLFSDDRDVVGSLGEQVVEQVLDMWGLPYKSTRKIFYTGGDGMDIEYDGEKIDVKTHRSDFNKKYFYCEDCMVFKHHLDKMMMVDYLLFVGLQREYKDHRLAVIYGVIRPEDFMEKAIEFRNEHNGKVIEGMKIKSRYLIPFRNYAFRTGVR